MTADLHTRIQTEIVTLHHFFEAWLSGRLPATEAGFAPFLAAAAPTFAIVTPTGARHCGNAVHAWLRSAHGTRGPDFKIWIADVALVGSTGTVAIAHYIEHQRAETVQTARRATAVLEYGGPRLIWHAVHETWIAPPPG